jgi:hypothetical protein
MAVTSEFIPEALTKLERRAGARPGIAVQYPSLQMDDTSPADVHAALVEHGAALANVTVAQTQMAVPGVALNLDAELAKGKPECFVHRREFAIIRDDGSVQVNLDPDCGQIALDRGWAVVHPLARYMAGALPPQSLIVFAPRDTNELAIVAMILEVAHVYAIGRIGDLILPDTAW